MGNLLFFKNKTQLATAIAILFHSIGFFGILYFHNDNIIKSTPINLLLMALLIWYTEENNKNKFFIFACTCALVGIMVELIGVHTGLLFGDYAYGKNLGPTLFQVPWIIGINWFIVIYSASHFINWLYQKIKKVVLEGQSSLLRKWSVIFDAAILAVFFDWLIEPVAIKLDFWTWTNQTEIPIYNYICWFFISLILVAVFQRMKFEKINQFAIYLLLIQSMFFLLLRTLL
jgi:putative membrane protein